MKGFIFEKEKRFLPLDVYQFPLGNCGGVTDGLDKESIYIPCKDGHVKYEEIENDNLIFTPEKRGEEYWALIPVVRQSNMVGPMAGGNLAYSCDSRCRRIYHIHDRWETQEQYEALSR